MQRLTRLFLGFRPRVELIAAALFVTSLLPGCSRSASPLPAPTDEKPFQGVSLSLRCTDERLRTLLEPIVRVWSYETGASVAVSAGRLKPNESVDLAILPADELGYWADRQVLLPIPANIREPGHAYQWSSVAEAYRSEAYAGWGNQLYGLPVATESAVVVYRADRFADPAVQDAFRKRFQRPLTPPKTWEAFADISSFFAEQNKKLGLPPVDPDRLEDLFFRVAACYDRPVITGEGATAGDSLAFQFRLDSGTPRLETLGFLEAGKWLANLKSRGVLALAANSDPAAALDSDRAAIAVLTLSDLMRLNRDRKREGRYGLAALPGTAAFVNPATGTLAPVASNTIPYRSGGWLGVVCRSCRTPEAAFALLAELTSPTRSQELIAAGGYAPVRETHLEADRTLIWLGYGFNDVQTRALQDVLRANLGKSVRNPTYGLRTPDREELSRELRGELDKIASGTETPENALRWAAEAWNRERAETPRAKRLEWLRRAAGLN